MQGSQIRLCGDGDKDMGFSW